METIKGGTGRRVKVAAEIAQVSFDAIDPNMKAALVEHAHGAAIVEDQDRLEGVDVRAAEMNARIDDEARWIRRESRRAASARAQRIAGGFAPDAKCESGWTGDRCTRPLFHSGPHSNERS